MKAEPAKTEAAKAETPKTDAVKTDTAKTDTAKTEPTKAAKPVTKVKHVHSKKVEPKLEPTATKTTTPAQPVTPKS